MTRAPSCEDNTTATAIREKLDSLKQKLTARMQRRTAQLGYEKRNSKEEELLQLVQKLEAECLDSASQVEYLQTVYGQSQARVLELEEIQRESAGNQCESAGLRDQAKVLAERVSQLEVALGRSTLRVQELETALNESNSVVRKWEGAYAERKAQVQDLEAEVAYLHNASEIAGLKAKLKEQSTCIPQLEDREGATAAAHDAHIMELEENHLEYTCSIILEEQGMEDAQNAEALLEPPRMPKMQPPRMLNTKVALLEQSNTGFQAALDMSLSPIAELEAEVLKSAQASSVLDLGSAHISADIASTSDNSQIIYFGRSRSDRSTTSSESTDRNDRPTTAAPAASPPQKIRISQGRTSPVATHSSGMRVSDPELGAPIQRLLQTRPWPRVLPREPCRSGRMAASPKPTRRRHTDTPACSSHISCSSDVDEKP
jgi:hypothetical protein